MSNSDIAHHFFGSNYAEWKTSDNLIEVIDWFRKQRNTKAPYRACLCVVPPAIPVVA